LEAGRVAANNVGSALNSAIQTAIQTSIQSTMQAHTHTPINHTAHPRQPIWLGLLKRQ